MPKKLCIIVVGCNYQDTTVSLKGCINDAIDVSQTLVNMCEKYNFVPTLHLLLDTDVNNYPSKSRLINLLTRTINDCNNKKYNNVIFYFAGHGYQRPDMEGDEHDGKDENILTADQQLIKDDEFKNILGRLKSNSVGLSFIFDCCHSGTILDLPKIIIGNKDHGIPRSKLNNKKILCICACDDAESSIERDGRGLFTKMFCRLIRNNGPHQPIFPLLKNIKHFFQIGNDKMSLTVSCSKDLILKKSNLFFLKSVKF